MNRAFWSVTILCCLLTVVLVVVLAWILKLTYAEVDNVSITISYNIGEIIAAFLGGTGAAAAGFGYAWSKMNGKNPNRE